MKITDLISEFATFQDYIVDDSTWIYDYKGNWLNFEDVFTEGVEVYIFNLINQTTNYKIIVTLDVFEDESENLEMMEGILNRMEFELEQKSAITVSHS